MVKLLRGGYELAAEDEKLLNAHKKITRQINDNFVRVGAVFCKPSSKNPIKDDWTKYIKGDTDLQSWVDDPNVSILNVGFNLQLGWVDFDIDSPDPEYNKSIGAALNYLGVESRFAFGRLSTGTPSHFLIQLNEDDTQNYANLTRFSPSPFKLGGDRFAVEIRSTPMNAKDMSEAKQTIVPGSIYSPKEGGKDTGYDLSVWYANNNAVAKKIEDVAVTTARPAFYVDLVRAIAIGTILYLVSPHWSKGSRQLTCLRVAGWLARLVDYAAAINTNDAINQNIFCPIDDEKIAHGIVELICKYNEDEEYFMRLRTFGEARAKLARNPDAKIPGWPSMIEMLGAEKCGILKRLVTPEKGASILVDMAEQYIHDDTTGYYVDRTRFNREEKYMHASADLERRHKSDIIQVGKKRSGEAWKVFEKSNLRRRVAAVEFIPSAPAGEIVAVDRNNRLVQDDDEFRRMVFNAWPGWEHEPIDQPDFEIMNDCVAKLDELLGYLTRNNENQVDWFKKWIAWLVQHPERKQQIAPVVIGGQGTGKSFFGGRFMPALLGRKLAGEASAKVLEGNFVTASFEGKLFVFIDEAKFTKTSGVEEIKKLIRNEHGQGERKFQDARQFNNYARIMMASNITNIGASQRDFNDRALQYMRAMDKDFLGMTEMEYSGWIRGLKQFFTEFEAMLRSKPHMQHFMRYFVDLPCVIEEIEDTTYSSGNDQELRLANSSWSRHAIKQILQDGYIIDPNQSLETPFDPNKMVDRLAEIREIIGCRALSVQNVMEEMRKIGLVAPHDETLNGVRYKMQRFSSKCADAINTFYEHTGIQVEFYREFDSDDYGDNDATLKTAKPRKTGKTAKLY